MSPRRIELFISSNMFGTKMLQLREFLIILLGGLELIKAATGVESTVPNLLVVLSVSVAPVSDRVIFINESM